MTKGNRRRAVLLETNHLALSGISNVVAPPIGNSLAAFWPGAPFALWSALAVFGIICLVLAREGSRGIESVGMAIGSVQVEMAD